MNLKLSTKLIGGFVIVGLVTLITGIIILHYVGELKKNSGELAQDANKIGTEYLPAIIELSKVQEGVLTVQMANRSLMSPYLSRTQRANIDSQVSASRVSYTAARNKYGEMNKGKDETSRKYWAEFEKALDDARDDGLKFTKAIEAIDESDILNPDRTRALIEQIWGDHYNLQISALKAINSGEAFSGGDDSGQCRMGQWLAQLQSNPSTNKEFNSVMNGARASHDAFHRAVGEIQAALKAGDGALAQKVYSEKMVPAANGVFGEFGKIRDMIAETQARYDEAFSLVMGNYGINIEKGISALNSLMAHTEEQSGVAVDHAKVTAANSTSAGDTAYAFTIIAVLVSFAIGLIFGISMSLAISNAMNRIITNLNEAGEQVAAASGQISSASQSLAEGATEQAASLEESSSALEEMASMTRQNADNAVNANQMMTQTQSQVSKGAEAVRNMSKAMGEINNSSEQISRIIKTIEEIAFQTNLLALNAAVEAARAGDAGKGFAVVADEVRNLAQRSAQAARDTADLIESTVARVKNGTEIAQELQKSFVEVESAANGVAGLINEISAASNEQAQGVDQVNTAVAQMDKVTQTNAANAEESASAAEELNAQAEQLRSLVNELVKLVRGNDAGNMEMHTRPQIRHIAMKSAPASQNSHMKHLAAPKKMGGAGKGGGASSQGKAGPNLVKPNQVIPFDDDDDFHDF